MHMACFGMTATGMTIFFENHTADDASSAGFPFLDHKGMPQKDLTLPHQQAVKLFILTPVIHNSLFHITRSQISCSNCGHRIPTELLPP